MQKIYLKKLLFVVTMILYFGCLLGCTNISIFSTTNPTEKAPIRTLKIKTDPSQRNDLGDQLSIFAKKHSLENKTAFYTNKKYDGAFFYVVYGENLEIVGYFTPESEITEISFFGKTKDDLPKQEYLNNIFNDLKIFLSQIPDVVILEEK